MESGAGLRPAARGIGSNKKQGCLFDFSHVQAAARLVGGLLRLELGADSAASVKRNIFQFCDGAEFA